MSSRESFLVYVLYVWFGCSACRSSADGAVRQGVLLGRSLMRSWTIPTDLCLYGPPVRALLTVLSIGCLAACLSACAFAGLLFCTPFGLCLPAPDAGRTANFELAHKDLVLFLCLRWITGGFRDRPSLRRGFTLCGATRCVTRSGMSQTACCLSDSMLGTALSREFRSCRSFCAHRAGPDPRAFLRFGDPCTLTASLT